MVWKWRWLTNLFGFQSGPGAKYFDADTYQLFNVVMSELEKKLISPAPTLSKCKHGIDDVDKSFLRLFNSVVLPAPDAPVKKINDIFDQRRVDPQNKPFMNYYRYF
jgi:hypothetical protein